MFFFHCLLEYKLYIKGGKIHHNMDSQQQVHATKLNRTTNTSRRRETLSIACSKRHDKLCAQTILKFLRRST